MTSIGPSHVLCCRRSVSRPGGPHHCAPGASAGSSGERRPRPSDPDTLTLHFGTRPDLGRAMVRARWVALFVVVGLAYLPRLDDVCGLFSDDAWYVLLARALATGEGYTLTNLPTRSEEHTSELQSPCNLVCRLLLEKKKTARKVGNYIVPDSVTSLCTL